MKRTEIKERALKQLRLENIDYKILKQAFAKCLILDEADRAHVLDMRKTKSWVIVSKYAAAIAFQYCKLTGTSPKPTDFVSKIREHYRHTSHPRYKFAIAKSAS
ncbi:MAG: hypothetical protein KME30_17255 [Iphinoe sp. HA4291-MV1]|jgi:hypothetical protein|nr:hypothetical protein [Iphinoe sp. HA4291-MV1]